MSNKEEEDSRQRLFLFHSLYNNDEFSLQLPGPVATLNSSINKGNPRKYTRVTRIAQIDTWDCGVACLLMIDQWLRNDNKYQARCEELKEAETIQNNHQVDKLDRRNILSTIGTESIWTSDLMIQLHSWKTNHKTASWWSSFPRFSGESTSNLAFVLASKQIMSADESYRDFQYYQNAFEEDKARVASTFHDLREKNVPMLQTATNKNEGEGLSISTVIEIVEQEDCLAIVLLDNNILFQGTTDQSSHANNKGNETDCRPYSGHYVILCGTSTDPKHVEIANCCEETTSCEEATDSVDNFCFVLCNPDPCCNRDGSNYTFVTPQRLELCWRAHGTDEDIIFVRKISKV